MAKLVNLVGGIDQKIGQFHVDLMKLEEKWRNSHWNWMTTDKNGRNWIEMKKFVCYLPFSMGKRRWIRGEIWLNWKRNGEIGDFSHWNWTTTDRNGRNWVEIKQFVCYWPFSMDKRCWIGREMAILATLAIEMWTTPDKNGRNWVEIEEFVCYLPVWMGERRWKCHKIARIAKKGRFSTRFCSGLNLETPSKASLRLRLLLLLLRLLPLLLFLLSYFSFLHLVNWKLVRIGGW